MQFDTQQINSKHMRSLDLNLSNEIKGYQVALHNSRNRALMEYNHAIDTIIPGILQRNFETNDGDIIKVKGVEIKFPQMQSDIGNTLMTPFIARMTGSTYKCDVYIDYVVVKSFISQYENGAYNQKQVYNDERIITKKIGSFHSLVGANRCITSVKPDEFRTLDEWKMFLSECPSSPNAYVIHGGGEKSIILDEKLRTNDFLTFKTKGDNSVIETRITCLDNSKTSLIRIRIGTHRPCIKVLFPHLKGKHYPLYLTYYLLYYSHNTREANKAVFDLNYLDELIASFVLPEYHDAVISYLKPSKTKFMELFVEIDQSGAMIINETKIQEYINRKLGENRTRNTEDDSIKFALSNAAHYVPNELFIQCKSYKDKLANFAMMTSLIILCGLSKRSFDSRDEWGKKKLDSIVRLIVSYTRDTLVEVIKSGKIDSKGFSFGKSDRKEAIVEARKSETLNAAIAERDKVDNQVNTRTDSLTLRKVDQTQFPIICPPKTPEGEKCGLSKELSALSHISYNQEYNLNRKQVFDDLLNQTIQYFSTTKTNEFRYKLACSNIYGQSSYVHYGVTQENISPDNIFFSKRLINIFKKYFKNKTAIYYIDIDTDTIWIKFTDPENQPIQYAYNTYTEGILYISIPKYCDEDFDVVTKITKNPIFNPFTSVNKTEECKYKLFFGNTKSEPQAIYFMYSQDKYSEVYISDLTINSLKNIFGKRAKISIDEGEDGNDGKCTVLIKGEFVKHKCVHWTTYNVVGVIPKIFVKQFEMLMGNINEYVSTKKSKTFSYSVTFNGIVSTYKETNDTFYPVILWSNGKKIFDYLKSKRRSGDLPYDSCIYMNTKDSSIQYFDDSGRVMAPMLIVDSKTNDLVLDKTGSWSLFETRDFETSSDQIETLYNEGSMELLDSKEMDATLIAESIEEIRKFNKLRIFLNSIDLKKIKSSIYKDTFGFYKNSDMNTVIINGNTHDIEFTLDKPDFETLSFDYDDLKYYGTYTFNKPVYSITNDEYYKLSKCTNPHITNGFHMLYFINGNFKYITKEDNFTSDGVNIYINDEPVKILYMKYPKDKEYIYVNRNLKEMEYIELSKPSNDYSIDNGKTFYRSNDRWIKPDEILNDHFILDNESYKIFTEVIFGDNDNGIFIEEKRKINEYIPITETNYQFYDEELYDSINVDHRENDLHIVSIKRSLNTMDFIDNDILNESKDYFGTLEKMVDEIPAFGNKKIVFNLRKYLNTDYKFTHCLINPNAAFSVIANMVPKADSNPGPRWSYQCSMGTQAIGVNNCVWYRRFDTTNKRLIAPAAHSFEPAIALPYSQVTMSVTQNFIFMVLAHRKGFEDPVLMSENCLKKFGRYVKETTIKIVETSSSIFTEFVCQPTDSMGNIKTGDEFRNIDEYGLPKLGSYIKVGDCVIGRSKVLISSGHRSNSSYMAGNGEEGYVSAINIVGSEGTEGSFRTINIKIQQIRYQQPGDKLAARFSQKGTIGDIVEGMINDGDTRLRIVDDSLMPYVIGGPNHGLRAEIVFNPASFPSRMTCGLIKECVCSKAAAYLQEKVDASNFHDLDMEYFNDALFNNKMLLSENGLQGRLDSNGNEFLCHSDGELMINSTDGLPLQVYIGIVAYQFLRHQVEDKKQCRSTGPIKPITHQPVDGKKNGGGARLGEMERDSFISHGSSEILFDRFMESSDGFKDVFCNYCKNNSAISNLKNHKCTICGTVGSLIVVNEPRVYKVYMQRMNAIGLNVKADFIQSDDFQGDILKKNIEVANKYVKDFTEF